MRHMATPPMERNCPFCRDKVDQIDYKNITSFSSS
jgi:ribosomal protein S18